MTAPDYWPDISLEHWTGTGYDHAMQLGIQSLRRSYTLPGGQGQDWILFGQREALQAAAWFSFARELREANNSQHIAPQPPLYPRRPDAPGKPIPPGTDDLPKYS